MVILYNKWKKYNEIQMTKYETDLNNRKMNTLAQLLLELILYSIRLQAKYKIILLKLKLDNHESLTYYFIIEIS